MMNSGFLPQMHFIRCLDSHVDHGVPIWNKAISYKELSELVRYWMVRIHAFDVIIGVEPCLSKGQQWPPVVQWNYKEFRSEANKGRNAT